MLTLDSNAANVVDALVRNIVTLAPQSVRVANAEFEEAGAQVLAMLSDESRLLPSYWSGSGDDHDDVVDAMNNYASTNRKLYFSIRYHREVSVALTIAGRQTPEIAQKAKQKHNWVSRAQLENPTPEIKREIGQWLYSMREDARAEANGARPMPYVGVASIHAGI